MNENRKYKAGDIPGYVIKTSSSGCCSGLVPCGMIEEDGCCELCPAIDGLSPLDAVISRDREAAMSGAYVLGSVLVRVCEAASRCAEWLIGDEYLDISENGLFYDPSLREIRILPAAPGEALSFGRRICDLALCLEESRPWLESRLLVQKLCESGASSSDDKKYIIRQISRILMK